MPYGVVVLSVNVSVFEYAPVRSASVAPMCWVNRIVTGSLETGPVHTDFENETASGDGSANVPFIRWPGSDTVNAASPAVEMTLAGVVAVYSFARPGVKAPNVAGAPSVRASVAGTVPATLSLTLASPSVVLGPFVPGVANDYTKSTTANVISTAGDAALSVSDPGHLANGSFTLPSPLEVLFSKSVWTAPVSNDAVTVTFKQHIGATDALRTGAYSKTLTFTLSTTTP